MESRINRVMRMFSKENRISRGDYSGFLLIAITLTTILPLIAYFSQTPVTLDIVQQILIFSCMALSYDYFSGYTGYYNLGYGAFVALGAYGFTFASSAGLTVPLSMLLGGIVSSGFAFFMSYPFLRLKGASFAIATLSLILLLYVFFANLYQYTGGTAGIILPYPTTTLRPLLFFASLIITILALYLHSTIGRSRFGLALRSIKEAEDVAEGFGVNVFRMKQIALVLSGFFGGVSGGLFALYLGFISVDTVMGLGVGLFPVVASLFGGTGIFMGPLIGSSILVFTNLNLPSVIHSIYPKLTSGPLVVTGFLLILVGLFMPGGVLRISYLRKYSQKQMDSKILKIFKR
jgi:branched-chain amino acid transport system permease protein